MGWIPVPGGPGVSPWSGVMICASLLVAMVAAGPIGAAQWPFEVTDLASRESLTFLVFGDGGTGEAGQYRVGEAMASVCRRRGCAFALMLGDNIYEDGIEISHRDDVGRSLEEVLEQFAAKFELPYAAFGDLPGFHFWAALGNHDYRRNAVGTMVTYSEFSALWRLPALHYEIPKLPAWIRIHAAHTDTDVRRDLNGLQVMSIRRRLCEPRLEDQWRFLFGHHPVHNSGHHRNDGNERRTRALLEEAVLRDCVHVYFAGHAHHQEHLTARGYEQVIQGAAGKRRGRNRGPAVDGPRQRHFSGAFGFAVVAVDPDRLRFDFYEVRNTSEGGARTAVAADEIVRAYTWCGTRDEVGRPQAPPGTCATVEPGP